MVQRIRSSVAASRSVPVLRESINPFHSTNDWRSLTFDFLSFWMVDAIFTILSVTNFAVDIRSVVKPILRTNCKINHLCLNTFSNQTLFNQREKLNYIIFNQKHFSSETENFFFNSAATNYSCNCNRVSEWCKLILNLKQKPCFWKLNSYIHFEADY